MDEKEEQEDSELIECFICKKCLNGKESLWVVCDFGSEPSTLCESCYHATRKDFPIEQ